MFERERLTLSLESTEVRLLIARGQQVLRWGRVPLPAGVVSNGQVAQPDVFGQVVGRRIKKISAPRREVVVSLGGRRAIVRILDLPPVPPKMLGEAIRRQAGREFPLPMEELDFFWQTVGGDDASRTQVFAVGIPKEEVDNCIAGLRGADVRPVAMEPKWLALVRAVNRPDVLIADVEEEAATVILVRKFVPSIVRSIALSGGAARPLAERAEMLIVEIQRTLDFYGSTTATERAAGAPAVCLTGALGGKKEVRTRVGARWRPARPEPPVRLPQEFPFLLPYLANIGLTLKSIA